MVRPNTSTVRTPSRPCQSIGLSESNSWLYKFRPIIYWQPKPDRLCTLITRLKFNPNDFHGCFWPIFGQEWKIVHIIVFYIIFFVCVGVYICRQLGSSHLFWKVWHCPNCAQISWFGLGYSHSYIVHVWSVSFLSMLKWGQAICGPIMFLSADWATKFFYLHFSSLYRSNPFTPCLFFELLLLSLFFLAKQVLFDLILVIVKLFKR